MAKRIAVVGGANMDIGGFPNSALVAGDSNPGRVRMTVGGVGRNIAENLARLGLEVELITALGDDANGRAILADCREKGIGVSAAQIEVGENSSVYLFIDDAGGDMSVAINDMGIQDRITPESLAPRLEFLNGMDAVVIDANLRKESIAYLAENLRVPIFADAVSAAKVGKLAPVLPKIFSFKPNCIEAELLTGMKISGVLDANTAAHRLLAMGLKRVFLTMGSKGAICADEGQCVYLPTGTCNIVNASGAGDAFTSALVWSWCEGMSMRECGIAGMAAASIAMEAVSAVNPEMSSEKLLERMKNIQTQLNI